MLAILFTNLAFLSSLVYIILEKKKAFYKSKKFWLVALALLASLYTAFYYLKMPLTGGHVPL